VHTADWTVWGANPGGGRDSLFSIPFQTGSGAHVSFTTMNIWAVFLGVKRPGRGFNHPLYLALRLRMSKAITLFPSVPLMACYGVTFTLNLTGKAIVFYLKICCSFPDSDVTGF